MVKAYLRYVQEASWGVIVSGGGQVVVDPTGKLAITPALDAVIVWDIKTQSIIHRLVPPGGRPGETSEVTALALASDGDTLAAGHANGTIHLWRLSDGEERTVLTGHRSAVTALHFNAAATLLASGSHDTNVVVWDVVGEAGVCRLRGHRDAVTDVCLLPGRKALASVSKDGTLRLWDLDMQHCVQTALAPSGELWSVAADAEWLFTGGAAGEVLAWRLEQTSVVDAPRPQPQAAAAQDASGGGASGGGEGGVAWEAAHVTLFGPLATKSSNRAARLRLGPDGSCLGCQYADRTVQLWSIQSEVQLKRQLKRRQEKGKKRKQKDRGDPEEEAEEVGQELSAADRFVHLGEVKGAAKLHSFAFMPSRPLDSAKAAAATATDGKGGEASEKAVAAARVARLLVATRNNAISVYEMDLGHGGRGASGTMAASVQSPGHRTEARGLAISSDDRMLLTGSDGEAKVWSLKTQQCLRTLQCGYALCVSFLCSSRFVAVGTKAGLIQLYSFATGEQVAEVQAHTGAVWSLQLEPGVGATALLSASADKTIATWTPIEGGGEGADALSLEPERSHDMGDDAMCACYSSDAKHLAVGLLDATVKVVFVDTFKQYLTLFGHKLPVLALSISSDGSLLVSASADKTVKIWGMDFGDCHRSLLAHAEPVTSVAFVRDTHYFFSAAKDKLVKFWDGDRFEQILSLPGHHAEVSGLVLTRRGDTLLSCSRDRSLRLWKRTDEQVFVEEERENELEQLFEAGLERQQPNPEEEEEAAGAGLAGTGPEAAGAGRRSIESVKGAERVLEALRVLREEAARRDEHAQALRQWESRGAAAAALGGSTELAQGPGKPPALVTNLLLLGLSEGAYLLKALGLVRAAELEQALLLLPYGAACELLQRLLPLLEEAPPAELMTRCVLFVLKVHHKQLVANAAMAAPLHRLDAALHGRLRRERTVLGYNFAALRMLKQVVEERDATSLFDDALTAKDAKEVASTAERQRATVARQGKAGGGKPGGNPKKKRRAAESGGNPKPV